MPAEHGGRAEMFWLVALEVIAGRADVDWTAEDRTLEMRVTVGTTGVGVSAAADTRDIRLAVAEALRAACVRPIDVGPVAPSSTPARREPDDGAVRFGLLELD